MKPWEIKFVEQKGPTCTIAALAMILGVTFEDVIKHFRWPEEMTLSKMADYLADHGYSIMIKELMYHSNPNFAREIISKPFAPAHIVHCKHHSDDMIQHVIVMDRWGVIFDPAGVADRRLSDYYMLTGVLGIWRPEDED